MRLGTGQQKSCIGTLPKKIYGQGDVVERHRHRYEFNMKYRDGMTRKALRSRERHRWYTGGIESSCAIIPISSLAISSRVQSKPNKPHPLSGIYSSLSGASADGAPHVAADPLSPHRAPDRELVRNDKDRYEIVELPQIMEQICRSFAQVCRSLKRRTAANVFLT